MGSKYSSFSFTKHTFRLFTTIVAHRVIEDITGTEKMLCFGEDSFGTNILIEEEYFVNSINRLKNYISLKGENTQIQKLASDLISDLYGETNFGNILTHNFVEISESFRKKCMPYGIDLIDE